jgi:ankyrin repeat protein
MKARKHAAAAAAHRHLFISAFIVTAQNGYGRDVNHLLHLARETWGEEQLFDAVKDLPHGALKRKHTEPGAVLTAQEKETVVDPFGKKRTRLMYAAQAGNVPRLGWLLARGARLELKDWEGHSALWWASYAGRKQTMRELLSRGAPLNPADGAPLHGASAGGQVEVVRELLSRGAQLELKDEKGRSALWWACEAGRVETAHELQAQGAATTDNYYWVSANATGEGGRTPLHTACWKGHLGVAEALLARDARLLELKDNNGHTALWWACDAGRVDVVRALLQRGAAAVDNCYWGKKGKMCEQMEQAIKKGHLEVVRELLAGPGGAVLDTQCSWTPLIWASFWGHTELVRKLLKGGAAVDATGSYGWTSLHYASNNAHEGVVRVLLDGGAHVNAESAGSFKPLHFAATSGISKLLRERGGL